MKVIKLDWMSESAQEAELIVSDGKFECLVFSHPCHVQLNQILDEPLQVLTIKNLMLVKDPNENERIVKIEESYFSHYCVARVKDMENSIVSVGGILIEFSQIPSWAKEGDLVEFTCSRFDIW
jgi:hypothetical protein